MAASGINDPNRVYDGITAWDGGVDSSLPATLISRNQAAWSVNRVCRSGYSDVRPGLVRRQVGYLQGLFQGFGTYTSDSGQVFAGISIGGRVFLTGLNDNTYPISELTSASIVNDPTTPHVWFCQAERNLIVQNNLNLPIFWNGVIARRSNGNATTLNVHELPPGGPTFYYQGRVWVAQGSNYIGGDIVNGNLSLADPRDSVLQCTENDFLNEGGSFAVPGIQGGITSITASANNDTSLGVGSLLIGTAQGIFAFNAPTDRTEWKNLQQPIQQYALIGFGPVSQEGFDNVNADMYFRSSDSEIRSYFYARRDFTNQWGNIPLSRQVVRAIAGEAAIWLYGSSGMTWQNRYLATVQPQRDQTTGIYYLGLASMDFFNVGGVGKTSPPAWDGVWAGHQFYAVFKATVNNLERAFAWVRNANTNQIELWEFDPGMRQDYDGTNYIPISWSFETRAMDFSSNETSPLDLKQLLGADLWFDQVAGNVSLLGYYRASLGPAWTPWASTSACSITGVCNNLGCNPPVFPNPLAFDRISFQTPDPAVNPQQNTSASWGYNFQIRVTGTGACRFKELRAWAHKKPEKPAGDLDKSTCISSSTVQCTATGTCPVVQVCGVNDYN
jgi:hypothetical protein